MTADINENLIEEARHWLDAYPEVLSLYNEALSKYGHSGFDRNLLDDLRLALEKLLRAVLGNRKSLEKQLQYVGFYIKERGGSNRSLKNGAAGAVGWRRGSRGGFSGGG
jgi:hypothetical protein